MQDKKHPHAAPSFVAPLVFAVVTMATLATIGAIAYRLGTFADQDIWDLHDKCRVAHDKLACLVIFDDLSALDRFARVNSHGGYDD